MVNPKAPQGLTSRQPNEKLAISTDENGHDIVRLITTTEPDTL